MKRFVLSFFLIMLTAVSFSQVTVQMTRQEGGTFLIPGKVNGVELNFVFDTGASNVCLSAAEAIFMLKNGYLNQEDIKGTSYAQIANGDIVENTEIVLRKVEVGGIVINNVRATVSHNLDAPLLFGQSAIQKLGPIQLNGDKLIIKNCKNFESNEDAIACYQKGFQQIEAEQFSESILSSEKGLSLTKDKKIRAYLFDNLATAYFRLDQIDKAIESANKGLSEDLYNPQLGYNLGYYLYCSNKKEQALKAFTQFVDKIPSYSNPDKSMLAAGFEYLGELQLEKGEILNAQTNLLKSIEYEPNQSAYLQLGDLYAGQRDFPKAIENYTKGISFEPNRLSNIKRYHQLGWCYIMNKDYDNAILSFNKCLECVSKNSELIQYGIKKHKEDGYEFLYYATLSNLELGRLYSIKEDARKSLSCYSKVLELPDNGKSLLDINDYSTIASVYNNLGDKEQAIEVIDKGLAVHTNNPDLLFAKSLLGNYDTNTIEILKQILKQEFTYEPNTFEYATVYNNIAWSYYKIGQTSVGLPYSKKAVLLNPEDQNNWDTLGELQYYLNNYEESIAAMTKCLELNPSNENALKIRGNSYLKIGKKKEGNADLKILQSHSIRK